MLVYVIIGEQTLTLISRMIIIIRLYRPHCARSRSQTFTKKKAVLVEKRILYFIFIFYCIHISFCKEK